MLICEVVNRADPLRAKLIGVVNQLKARQEDMDAEDTMTVKALLNRLESNGISVDRGQLFDMIKNDPLKSIIRSIEGNTVHFVGSKASTKSEEEVEDAAAEDDKETQDTLDAMAKSATKKSM